MYLSDIDIQDYLDNNLDAIKMNQIQAELERDSELRNRIKSYQRIYTLLEDNEGFKLPVNFTPDILKKAHMESLGSVHFKLWHLFIGLFILILIINVTYYYVDLNMLLKDLSLVSEFKANKEALNDFSNSTNHLLTKNKFDYSLPISSVIVLLALFLIDRLLFTPKRKPASFLR